VRRPREKFVTELV